MMPVSADGFTLIIGTPAGRPCGRSGTGRAGLSLPKAAPGPRRPNESHTTHVGSRIESDEPDA